MFVLWKQLYYNMSHLIQGPLREMEKTVTHILDIAEKIVSWIFFIQQRLFSWDDDSCLGKWCHLACGFPPTFSTLFQQWGKFKIKPGQFLKKKNLFQNFQDYLFLINVKLYRGALKEQRTMFSAIAIEVKKTSNQCSN